MSLVEGDAIMPYRPFDPRGARREPRGDAGLLLASAGLAVLVATVRRCGRAARGEELGRADAIDAMAAALRRRERELARALERHDAALRRQMVLTRELQHRVGNTLATVQALARQSLPKGAVAPELREALEGRLLALGRAHALLSHADWRPVGLAQMVEGAVAPFRAAGPIVIEGPAVRVPAEATLALAMALHELGSNALRHGALRAAGGTVALSWASRGAGGLVLNWDETAVLAPCLAPRAGFGSRLLDRVVAHQLHGRVERNWRADGLRCRMVIGAAAGVQLEG